MDLSIVKPRAVNLGFSVLILILPIWTERVPSGSGFVTESYSPAAVLLATVFFGEWYGLLLMLGFSLLVYLAVSLFVSYFS